VILFTKSIIAPIRKIPLACPTASFNSALNADFQQTFCTLTSSIPTNSPITDYKEQVIELLLRVCTVSVETMKIIMEMSEEI
jgi:hypothetical protein